MAAVSEALIPMLRKEHEPNSEGGPMAGNPMAYDLGPATGILVGVVASGGLWVLILWVMSLAI
jgi:hypothetical protein